MIQRAQTIDAHKQAKTNGSQIQQTAGEI
jgi:hypothetical protein